MYLLIVVCLPVALTATGATRRRRPVASEVALDMPHQAMLSVLPQSTAVAIEMAMEVHSFVIANFAIDHNRS